MWYTSLDKLTTCLKSSNQKCDESQKKVNFILKVLQFALILVKFYKKLEEWRQSLKKIVFIFLMLQKLDIILEMILFKTVLGMNWFNSFCIRKMKLIIFCETYSVLKSSESNVVFSQAFKFIFSQCIHFVFPFDKNL